MDLDQRDQALISLLKANSRTPIIELAKQLAVSRSTVQNRIETLQRRGIIKKFTIEFDQDYERKLLKAQMLVNLTAGVSRQVIKQLQQYPQITSIMSVSGVYDLIVELTVEASSQLDQLVDDIRETKGIEKTVTCVVLSKY
ncbi:MAG: Lrp/AsnC family transcriptional regulator [Saccharospirillaceae bacterium]|nr:Lrp/AsnC family transcriptional regulator [Pseudomonadales bacterium]NRB79590.1 Lrp/AsnC family transcriptional regulator [Saccharospirillaceae bacterium]